MAHLANKLKVMLALRQEAIIETHGFAKIGEKIKFQEFYVLGL